MIIQVYYTIKKEGYKMDILEAIKTVKDTSLVYARNQLNDCTEENCTKAYIKCCEKEVEAIETILAELESKDKEIEELKETKIKEFATYGDNCRKCSETHKKEMVVMIEYNKALKEECVSKDKDIEKLLDIIDEIDYNKYNDDDVDLSDENLAKGSE
jgi:Asp-tRNA(Asn)/Glu-tRNA(Gln) amidotransferase C subunit